MILSAAGRRVAAKASGPAAKVSATGAAPRRFLTGPQQKVLAAWKRLDVVALEKQRMVHSRTVSDVMAGVLGTLKLDRKKADTEVLRVWNNLIDPVIVAHAQPTGLHKGTLFVTVDHSTWLDEIVRYRRREILERLQHSFGKDLITRISFRVG